MKWRIFSSLHALSRTVRETRESTLIEEMILARLLIDYRADEKAGEFLKCLDDVDSAYVCHSAVWPCF